MKNCQFVNVECFIVVCILFVQFYFGVQIVMVVGLDNVVLLFQVDGKINFKIQSIYLERFLIFKVCFSVNGEEVLVMSIYSKVFYVYDMLVGKLIFVY